MIFFEKIFLKLFHHYYDVVMNLRKLESVNIEVTKSCNLQCKHCYMNSSVGNVKGELNKKDWFNFFDELKKKYGNKITIAFSGGEVLVKEDFFEILEYVKKLGFIQIITTNGVLLNKKNIKRLDNLIDSIGISVDGFEKEHNYLRGDNFFEKIIENIKLIKKESKINVGIKTTIFSKNCDTKYLEKFFGFVKDLNVDLWHFFPMEPIGRGEKNIGEIMNLEQYEKVCDFVDKIKKEKNNIDIVFQEQSSQLVKSKFFYKIKRCMAGVNSLTILSNGNVVKCLHSDNPEKPEIYGNVLKDNLKIIWEENMKKSIKNKKNFCIKPYFLSKMKEKYNSN